MQTFKLIQIDIAKKITFLKETTKRRFHFSKCLPHISMNLHITQKNYLNDTFLLVR